MIFFLHFTVVLKTSCWADFVHFQNSNRLQKITRLSSKWCRLLTSPNKTDNEDSSSQYCDSFIVTCEITFNAVKKIINNTLVAQKTSKWEKTWRPKDGDDWNGLKMSAKILAHAFGLFMPWLSNNSTILHFFFCSWLSILLMLSYMGTVIVILLNILIAQMSTTYTQAKKVARLEYDVDRISLLTRMERFPFLVSKWQRTEIEFWNVLSQEDCSPACSLVFWVRECTRVCRVLVKTGLSFFGYMLNVHYAKNVSSLRLGFEATKQRCWYFISQWLFPLQNLRVKYYKEGDWISEMKLAKGLE